MKFVQAVKKVGPGTKKRGSRHPKTCVQAPKNVRPGTEKSAQMGHYLAQKKSKNWNFKFFFLTQNFFFAFFRLVKPYRIQSWSEICRFSVPLKARFFPNLFFGNILRYILKNGKLRNWFFFQFFWPKWSNYMWVTWPKQDFCQPFFFLFIRPFFAWILNFVISQMCCF